MTTTTELPELKPWQAPRVGLDPGAAPIDFRWSGYLTTQNAGHVAQRIREQFGSDAIVCTSAHEYRRWEPEVQAPVRIEEVHCDVDARHAHVFFPCGGYVIGFDSWEVHEQPPLYLHEQGEHGPARRVLDWIRDSERMWRTPFLEFDQRTLTVRNRAPNEQAYWLRFDRLEGPHTGTVVLQHEDAAVAWEALSNASSLRHLDNSIDVRTDLEARIERAFGDEGDGEKIERWLPRD